MHNRIAIAALAALFVSSSMLAAPAKPASADADDHSVNHHHHAFHNGHPNGNGWYNGKYYGTGNPNVGYIRPDRDDRVGHPDRDDRKRHHHPKRGRNYDRH